MRKSTHAILYTIASSSSPEKDKTYNITITFAQYKTHISSLVFYQCWVHM